jgi:hypothetical protein
MYHHHDIDVMSRIIDSRARYLSFDPWSGIDPLGGRESGRSRSARLRRRSEPAL